MSATKRHKAGNIIAARNSIREVSPQAYPDVPQNGGKEKWQNIVN